MEDRGAEGTGEGPVISKQSKVEASVTVVVAFFNEADTLAELVSGIDSQLNDGNRLYEIVLVDDGSSDGGSEVARSLCTSHRNLRLIRLARNFGKAAALSAGMAAARGEIVITMDADLQDDPRDIPRFLEELDSGCDVVSGWKKTRKDPLSKTIPSRVFNWMVRLAFNLTLHDVNCGFKAYRGSAVRHLHLYGELHRFTPALLHAAGFSVREIEVTHHARRFGKSKYGFTRMIKGLFDLVTVMLLTRYRTRPLHFFGGVSLLIGLIGFWILSYLTVLWFLGHGPIGDRPLLLLGILLVTTATQVFGIGLIAELVLTSQLTEEGKYVIRERVGFDQR